MRLDLGRIISRSFSISWRHKWLWLLGVFGGTGGSFSYRSGSNFGSSGNRGGQVSGFITDHLALILAAAVVLIVIALVSFVITLIAIPAATWAGLQLDAGHEVTLGMAWGQGVRRFWRYFRLVLLKGLLGLAILPVVAVLVLLGVVVFTAGGPATLLLLVPLGVLLVFAFVAVAVVLSFALVWSDRLLVILGVGAVDSIRASWWLFRHNKLNTVVLAIVVGAINLGVGIGLTLAAVLVASPGILMLIVYFAQGAPSVLAIAGFTWVIVLGGGAILVGSGFLGAVSQVAFALAARDLSITNRLSVLPDVIGWDPTPPPAVAPGLAPAT